ncbi:MAG TPA: ABC transporter ATP-binding protein [Methylomirabilota bacterium]|jgi:spermidine/putrescine ABC transporter ATP-binding subunit|nr:ABC transporter ATP-binding protein [Methylomirabilota bacterium]
MTEPVDVHLERVSKRFGPVAAVDDVSLEVRQGEVLALLGPSGCGKTTTLRIVAGFEDPDTGAVRIRGTVVNDIPTYRRNLGMVFQHYALFPHMSVFDNVAFGLRMRGVGRGDVRRRVSEAMTLVRLEGLEERFPSQLSGGQQQRVALARAVVTKPAVLLLDEPLGALDKKLREQMQVEIRALQREVGITTIFVTHDQEEALTLADRIAVMERGAIVQIGTPTEIYERPRSRFVSDFIGISNFLAGRIVARGAEALTVELPAALRLQAAGVDGLAVGDPVELAIRPEKIRLAAAPLPAANCVAGQVEHLVYLGAVTYYYLRIAGEVRLVVMEQNQTARPERPPYPVGTTVYAGWDTESTVPLKQPA